MGVTAGKYCSKHRLEDKLHVVDLMAQTISDRHYSLADAAERLGMSVHTLRRILSGQLTNDMLADLKYYLAQLQDVV